MKYMKENFDFAKDEIKERFAINSLNIPQI